MNKSWYTISVNKINDILHTSHHGLSSDEALGRLAEHGPNLLAEKANRSLITLFIDQFKDFMIIVLIIAAIIAGALGEVSDTIAIIIIVVLNGVIGFVQEYRAEKAMEALKKMSAPMAKTFRSGRQVNLDASELVPGDIVILEAGDIVPADLRLFDCHNLQIDESALTGESLAITKMESPLPEEKLPLGDQKNMAFKGTIITVGRSLGVVVATGMKTELGKIAGML
jgi:Ca2+-transporting ATPase